MILLKLMTTLASGAPSFEVSLTLTDLGLLVTLEALGFSAMLVCFVSLSPLLLSDPLMLKDLR